MNHVKEITDTHIQQYLPLLLADQLTEALPIVLGEFHLIQGLLDLPVSLHEVCGHLSKVRTHAVLRNLPGTLDLFRVPVSGVYQPGKLCLANVIL